MGDCEKLKSKLQSAHCAYHELDQKMQNDPKWAWTHVGQREKLQKASDNVRVKLSDFHKEWLYGGGEVKEMKAKYSAARCRMEFTQVLKLQALVKALETVCTATIKSHNEMQKS